MYPQTVVIGNPARIKYSRSEYDRKKSDGKKNKQAIHIKGIALRFNNIQLVNNKYSNIIISNAYFIRVLLQK